VRRKSASSRRLSGSFPLLLCILVVSVPV
jgi:hypothetical protein